MDACGPPAASTKSEAIYVMMNNNNNKKEDVNKKFPRKNPREIAECDEIYTAPDFVGDKYEFDYTDSLLRLV